MLRRWLFFSLCGVAWLGFAPRLPAPLIYTPGIGWHYEAPGEEKGGGWIRDNARDQLTVAREAFDRQDYSVALKAAKRVVSQWPFSDYAPEAQYFVGRCYEARRKDELAFKAYQRLLERYPKSERYSEVLQRQFEIANRFLKGQWFKLWGVIPFFPSMDKTIKLYEQIIKTGPESEVAPKAQINIGRAHERKLIKDYAAAAEAFERAADRYADRPEGVDALFLLGQAYLKQAKRAEYDQSIAEKAIETFTDFITLYPDDPRAGEAEAAIKALKTEQARGSYAIARFYEKRGRWRGALIYYNEVLLKDPGSKYAELARRRIDAIQQRNP